MEIRIPEVGESVVEALVAKWYKKSGERVEKDEPVCEVETDKISMELNAETAGVLSVKAEGGTTVRIGSVIGVIDEVPSEIETAGISTHSEHLHRVSPMERKAERKEKQPRSRSRSEQETLFPDEVRSEAPVLYEAGGISRETVDKARTTRQPMSPIRRRIAKRLLEARQKTAMLTTFNEADMGRVLELRKKHGEEFARRHGVKLGIMPFFVKACVESLKEFPAINARIEGDDIVFQHYYDIGIAVSGEKGLVVPVLRDADRLHFAEIEKGIEDFVDRIRNNRLSISDLEGGTFTITNGGVFGSLLSTPILNPPQSAVLGMHTIQERPVARNDKVVIRPMMYLALSYDHRIVDGRESVQFLRKVIEYIEKPEEMLIEG